MPGWPATGEHFGATLEFLNPEPDGGLFARLRFLAPDLATPYLSAGAELLLMEGPRVVAESKVVAVL
jgi:hypothetical protein